MPDTSRTSVGERVRAAASRLNHRLDAELLLAFVLKRDRSWLIAHAEALLTDPQLDQLERLIERRERGTPMAYITGIREFYGRDFQVSPAVLIPRPETELLVDQALDLALPETCRVLDVGTGSGCLILTLLAERPGWSGAAIDLSPDALAMAQRNQKWLGLANRSIEWITGSVLSPLSINPNPRFELIVSNPPYVAEGDAHLDQGDLRFEPTLALSSGTDGLDMIRQLIDQTPHHQENG
ncbi:MAG: peptide chain release factor N(5)-glutamine methyltransferase, partial [Pseudomonadota bacterium]